MAHAVGWPEPAFVLDPAEIVLDRTEVLRYLGYPRHAAAGARISSKVDEAIESCPGRIHARGTYSLYGVADLKPDSITLEGGTRICGDIGDFLSGARRAAVFVATAGPEIVETAESATRRRDALSGLVYNAIGSHIAEAALSQLLAKLRQTLSPGESLTLPYSPGYCGISLSQQRTMFRLVRADRIGVELLPTLVMKPVKSISGLVGIGPEADVRVYGNPCDRCPNTDCAMRREGADQEA